LTPWNNPTGIPERLQQLHFLEDAGQILVDDIPKPLATGIVRARESDDRAWVINEQGERVPWLLLSIEALDFIVFDVDPGSLRVRVRVVGLLLSTLQM
jgi:hypothetical protein